MRVGSPQSITSLERNDGHSFFTMTKMRRPRPEAPDSSSNDSASDDSSVEEQETFKKPEESDSSSSEASSEEAKGEDDQRRPTSPATSSDDSESDSDSEDEQVTVAVAASARAPAKADDSSSSDVSSHADSDSDNDASSSDNNDDDNLPIADRLAKQQAAGVDMRAKRERQQKARALAKERLGQAPPPQRRSKHAPTQASSKRSDFYRRKPTLEGVGVDLKHYKPNDPRMSSLAGRLDEDAFYKSYEFVGEIREQEIRRLRQRISAYQTKGRKGNHLRARLGVVLERDSQADDEAELKRLLQEKADVERRQIDRAAKRAVKKKVQEEVAEGKRGAFYLKRKEKRRLELEARYEELKKRGGHRAVEKAVAKRRKKNKSKDASMLGGRPRDE